MAISIDTPVQYLKGVGPKLGEVLRKRGIGTVEDLLHWFPRTYEDRRAIRNISSLEPDQYVSLVADVVGVRSATLGRSRRRMYEIIVADKTGRIACKYFRVPYKGYFERFQPQDKVRVVGKVTEYRGRIEFHHPDVHHIRDEEDEDDALIPLYTETEGLSPAKLRKIIDTALTALMEAKEEEKINAKARLGQDPKYLPKPERMLVEPLPDWICSDYKLPELPQAIREIHQPPKHTSDLFLNFKAPAQRRVIFEEFFWLELLLATKRAGLEKEDAPALKCQGELVQKLIESLEFQLTGAQQKAFKEIAQDLAHPHPMHRLVQGDVGSGKTMVALLAAVHAAECGYQTSLMVPTEILAEQHFKNSTKRLEPLGLRVALLTGQMKASERQEVYAGLESGEIHLVVGTHALIQSEVKFKNLALVIIDEQHRFGVAQRMSLKEKGLSPHF
ncbi:MAG: DEAD/DEAH box helicase, partial [Bdellovibrionales bacterium]|nr:DEAD/DEAH box helicase [Bdellovibrionales bacterium]